MDAGVAQDRIDPTETPRPEYPPSPTLFEDLRLPKRLAEAIPPCEDLMGRSIGLEPGPAGIATWHYDVAHMTGIEFSGYSSDRD